MKKVLFFGIAAGVVLIGCKSFGSSLIKFNNSIKLKYVDRIVYFDPEVFPDYDGIKAPPI